MVVTTLSAPHRARHAQWHVKPRTCQGENTEKAWLVRCGSVTGVASNSPPQGRWLSPRGQGQSATSSERSCVPNLKDETVLSGEDKRLCIYKQARSSDSTLITECLRWAGPVTAGGRSTTEPGPAPPRSLVLRGTLRGGLGGISPCVSAPPGQIVPGERLPGLETLVVTTSDEVLLAIWWVGAEDAAAHTSVPWTALHWELCPEGQLCREGKRPTVTGLLCSCSGTGVYAGGNYPQNPCAQHSSLQRKQV